MSLKFTVIKKAAFIIIFVFLNMMGYGQGKATFPYILSKTDVPAGFRISGPFSREDKSISLSAHQGIVTNRVLISTIYEKINVNAVNKVYVTSYVPGKHSEDGLIVYIMQFKNRQLFDREKLKLPRNKFSRYLEQGNYLFMVFSSGVVFQKEVNAMAGHLKKRWGLAEIRG